MAGITPELALKSAIALLNTINLTLADVSQIPEAIKLTMILMQRLREGNRSDLVNYAMDLQSSLSAKDIKSAVQIIQQIYTSIISAKPQQSFQGVYKNRIEVLRQIEEITVAIDQLFRKQIPPALELALSLASFFSKIGEEQMAAYTQEHLVSALKKKDIDKALTVNNEIWHQIILVSPHICPSCGKQNRPIAKFCTACGTEMPA